jgi:hypothetical protein
MQTIGVKLEIKDYSYLFFIRDRSDYVELFYEGELVGCPMVWESMNKEYIIVNSDLVYLDTINQLLYDKRDLRIKFNEYFGTIINQDHILDVLY